MSLYVCMYVCTRELLLHKKERERERDLKILKRVRVFQVNITGAKTIYNNGYISFKGGDCEGYDRWDLKRYENVEKRVSRPITLSSSSLFVLTLPPRAWFGNQFRKGIGYEHICEEWKVENMNFFIVEISSSCYSRDRYDMYTAMMFKHVTD